MTVFYKLFSFLRYTFQKLQHESACERERERVRKCEISVIDLCVREIQADTKRYNMNERQTDQTDGGRYYERDTL